MNKEELREGLKRLYEYVSPLDYKSVFLEEGNGVPMDTLLLGVTIGEELSMDISCNFAHAPEFGDILHFYGELDLEPLLEENPDAFSERVILKMINGLNKSLPIGQIVYLTEDSTGKSQKVIGIRYTMLTGLSGEDELRKCVSIIEMLMNIYEILCSTLYLLLEGDSLEKAMETLSRILEED
ncbi:MAG: hypothetical protein HFG81_06635 [Dorea sp.]|nr:hypothetical protein [Sporofaciens musculi]MCI9422378.1 hypothetical protein [Dorea sp.]